MSLSVIPREQKAAPLRELNEFVNSVNAATVKELTDEVPLGLNR